jgi:protein-tyrosine phosphatase
MATVSFTSQLKTHAWTPLQGALRVMVARSISRTKSSDFPALKKTLDRGMLHTSASNHLDYNAIDDNFFVGTCPKDGGDIDKLSKDDRVTAILNLQHEEDIAKHNVNIASIEAECNKLRIVYLRVPIHDHDTGDLTTNLPRAVGMLDKAISIDNRKVYLHCTAGAGRSPSVAAAYYFWFKGMDLHTADAFVRSKRPVCHPNTAAIKDKTDKLLDRQQWLDNLTGTDKKKIQHDVLTLVSGRQ